MAGAVGALALSAAAEGYPAKPITIVVAYPAGGDTDALARVFAEKLSARVKQPVVVDNRAGASGVIGSSYVSKAPADGYTLLMAPSTFSIAQLVLKTGSGSGYDVVNGFTPIFQLGTQPLFLAAGPAGKAATLKDVLAASKAAPMAYASPGSGSPMHILGEMFNKASGAGLRHVPYKGIAPGITDVVGGHVPLTWVTYGPAAPYLADGKMRLLAVAQGARSPLAPEVPTLAELGYKDVEVVAWNGLFGPKGLPADIVQQLNGHFNEILKMPDVLDRMKTLGTLPVGGAPAQLAKTNAADLERFTRIVKELNILPD
ncbi:ABC transporter substrate-binding protein [Pseudorhodoferax sp. Leaf274]|nr:ABC transporter substrate-binding protein [Pseudorhodoferax sp. Leaf274]